MRAILESQTILEPRTILEPLTILQITGNLQIMGHHNHQHNHLFQHQQNDATHSDQSHSEEKPPNFHRAFMWGVILNVAYVIVEGAVGIYSNSLALLADAGHNLSDVLGLLLAWGAHRLSQAKPTERRTYGWRSSSILAAVLNALLLLSVTGGIAWEAIQRLNEPNEIVGLTIIITAAFGVLINTGTALLFLRGRHTDLNIRGAYLHMAADAAVSIGVVISGLIIYSTGWNIVDPLCSLLIAIAIFIGTWSLLKESLNLMLHAVPNNIDPQAVANYLTTLPDVETIHDLHIWATSTTENALTVHLVKPNDNNEEHFLTNITQELKTKFHIHHTTIQIERQKENNCPTNCQ